MQAVPVLTPGGPQASGRSRRGDLGVSRRAIYHSIRARECPSAHAGRRVVIPTARFLRRYDLVEDDGDAAGTAAAIR
jgi:hypothetical protein